MSRVLCLLLAASLGAGACVPVRHATHELTDQTLIDSNAATAEHFRRRQELTDMIAALGAGVDRREASLLAQVALTHPFTLAERYRLTRPAITHNFLVNSGIKPRGLCVHWTEDMLLRLRAMELTTLDLYWGVADPDRAFRLQHSTPVVTARGAPFESGIVLDGWRDSGVLFYSRVPDDTRYTWQRHFKVTASWVPVSD